MAVYATARRSGDQCGCASVRGGVSVSARRPVPSAAMTNKSVRPPAAATSWNTIAPPCAGPTGGPTGPGVGSFGGAVGSFGGRVAVGVEPASPGTTTTRPVIAPCSTQ